MILCGKRSSLITYHYNGEREQSGDFLIPAKWDAAIRNIEWANGGFLFYSETGRQTDKVKIYYFHVKSQKFIPFDIDVPFFPSQINMAVQFHAGSDNIWITKNFCDTLFIWEDEMIKPKYHIPALKSFFPDLENIGSSFKLDYEYVQGVHQVLSSRDYLVVRYYQKGKFINLYYKRDQLTGQLINLRDGGATFRRGYSLRSDMFYLDDTLALDYVFDLQIRSNFDSFTSLKKEMAANQFKVFESTYASLIEGRKKWKWGFCGAIFRCGGIKIFCRER